MGMSASQARFLCLTARKNNVEFEGQQINQQRTCLSNESATYYSELCNMSVPVPPSVDDYTKVTYTFDDGAMKNTITSLLYSSTDKSYHVSFLQEWQDDYSIAPTSSSLVLVTDSATNTHNNIAISNWNNISENGVETLYNITPSTSTYSVAGTVLRLLGVGPDGSTVPGTITEIEDKPPVENPTTPPVEDPTTPPVENPTTTPVEDPTSAPTSYYRHYINIDEGGTPVRYEVFYEEPGYSENPDECGQAYYNKGEGELTSYEESMVKYYSMSGNVPTLQYFVGNNGKVYAANDIQQSNPITVNNRSFIENGGIIATEDESHNISILAEGSSGRLVKTDDNGVPLDGQRIYITDPSLISQIEHEEISSNSSHSIAVASENHFYNISEVEDPSSEEHEAVYSVEAVAHTQYETSSTTKTGDPYWDSLTSEQRTELLNTENYYRALLQESLGTQDLYYVRYVKNENTGAYEPIFYSQSELQNTPRNDRGLVSVAAYTVGPEVKTREVLNKTCAVEQDSSGRYISITVSYSDTDQKTYKLNTTTSTDEAAYNDAMNDYFYQQNAYEHKIQEINSKLEIIQHQDKQLELKLKQLDTEENAISTEMDAVKKVISKNVDSSFKTFSA